MSHCYHMRSSRPLPSSGKLGCHRELERPYLMPVRVHFYLSTQLIHRLSSVTFVSRRAALLVIYCFSDASRTQGSTGSHEFIFHLLWEYSGMAILTPSSKSPYACVDYRDSIVSSSRFLSVVMDLDHRISRRALAK